MFRSTSRRLLLIAGIALCAILGFVAGKALANVSPAGAAAGYFSAQTDAPTPSGSSGIIGSLAQNPAVTEPADPSDNPADVPDAPESDLSGTVAQVDAAHSSLTLATSQGNVLIVVGAQTDFGDSLSSLADLQPGMALDVSVEQANGQLNADSIDLADPAGDPSND